MKKGLKIAAITVGVIIILMFLLPFAFQGKIADIVKTEGNKMLNAQFDFKNLNISLFRNFPQASVTLEDFWLKGTGEFANDTLVQAGEVTAAVNLFSLFGDSGYDISKIFIEDTKLHAIILPDGRANWDIMKPDTIATAETPVAEEEEASSPFKVKLQRFVIKNMNLIYDDQQGKMYADIRDFNAICAGDLGSERTTLKLEAETKSLTYKMNGIPFLANANISAKMDVDADLANNKYTLKDNTIRLNAIQAGVILLPVQSVGVMGDERTYERAVALRAVTSTDAMTADWAHLPYEFMGKISNDIINKVKGVNRVTYDISSKPPATIEWE